MYYLRGGKILVVLEVLVVNTNTNGHQFPMLIDTELGASSKQTTMVKDFSNPVIVDSLLKNFIWSSMQHVFTWNHWLVQSKRLLAMASPKETAIEGSAERQVRSLVLLEPKTSILLVEGSSNLFRGDGSSKNYKVLSEMLEDFDRQDVEELYRLVKKKYSASRLEGFDLMLWGDLYVLFESDEEDEIWKSQHEYNLISWRLCDFCGIHILLMENGLAIHMLTEKKYPLSQEMISKMLKKKLEVDHESSQAILRTPHP
ncbi:hypothetical protein Tco_0341645 [Tanacetum coccineum]